MAEDIDSINSNSRILVSRNTPIAFVVGVAGFIGSQLAHGLLKNGIQVIGLDDLSSGNKSRLAGLIRHRNFHFINQSITTSYYLESTHNFLNFHLPRLDYAFFVADGVDNNQLVDEGVRNFLSFIRTTEERNKNQAHIVRKTKIVYVSTIDLYNESLDEYLKRIKYGEIRLAKFVQEQKLNARIVRLAPVFGPGMHFRSSDPLIRLIQATLLDKLELEKVASDYLTRAIYIDDAVKLLLKTALSGSTASKIYDGASIRPYKVDDVKQILVDPLWSEHQRLNPTELPEWPTPNLEKTIKELSWKIKDSFIEDLRKTIAYFKEHDQEIPDLEPKEIKQEVKKWSLLVPPEEEQKVENKNTFDSQLEVKKRSKKGRLVILIGVGLIVYGLFFPIFSLGFGAFNIKQNLKNSQVSIEKGDFDSANKELKQASETSKQLGELMDSFSILKKIGPISGQYSQFQTLLSLVDEGLDGASHASAGMQSLYQASKIISGEQGGELQPLYDNSQLELDSASDKLSSVKTKLADKEFSQHFPAFIQDRQQDLVLKMEKYANLVEKGRAASFLLPKITAVNSKKSYLVLLQNNLELRPTGGFIGSYAKLTFENGKLSDIKVDDIYNLDGNLKDVIKPPDEIVNDLGQKFWYLRDSNFEPDFPTSARQAEFFYRREAGETINGVFALDLAASGKLLSAVGGIDLPDYGEHVDGSNLFEKSISHAEVNFFPGSQAKKNYLTALENQLFNKIFFLSKQNWPAIIQALGESLEQKHMLLYLADSKLFAYAISENWAGIMPREQDSLEGQTNDFLAAVDSNMGANKSNYYLERSFRLETAVGKEGQVSHVLRVTYKNNSPSEVFPAGKYKNRFRLYLPAGSKLTSASFGETDVTSSARVFSDYGRTGFSLLLEVAPKEQKVLTVTYQLPKALAFKDNLAHYRLDVIKQAGTDKDPFDFNFTYPINMKLKNTADTSNVTHNKDSQEINIASDLQVDRSFSVDLTK